MYPTLYHALKDLLGLDLPFLKLVNSFGFFVVLAFIAAAWTLSKEIERKTKSGLIRPVKKKVNRGVPPSIMSYVTSALIGFIIGYKLIYLVFDSSVLSDAPSYLFSSEGSMIGGLIGAAGLFYLRYREWKSEKSQYPTETEEEYMVPAREHANNLAVQAAIWGFIGAKLFFIFEDPDHIKTFFTNFSVNSVLSGLTIYGGLILGTIGVLRYFSKNGIPPLVGADAAAPGFLLAYGIGRIGCQVSGDGDWGIVNTAAKPNSLSWLPDWMWAYDYPNNVNGVGVPLPDEATIFEGYGTHLVPPVWPTPIYETLMAVGLFLILWVLRKRLKAIGAIFFLTFAFNGIERWFIEKIRVNEKIDFLGLSLTQAEYISILITLIGVIGFIWVMRKRPSVDVST
ncbi:MAG: diacylglyceryl transferase [Flavobacteriales bacterium]|nr:diacylglyceryl transferase [Flavobacteriales bacterium]